MSASQCKPFFSFLFTAYTVKIGKFWNLGIFLFLQDPPTTTMNGKARRDSEGSAVVTRSTSSEAVQLKQTLGLFNGVAMIVGVVVGSGIFVSPKGVLLESGSVGLALVVWTVSGVICLLGALCFAELGTMIVSSGGMYAYIQEAFGGLPAFLYLWVSLIITFPAANAVIALTCGYYVLQPLFPCGAPLLAVQFIGALAIGECLWRHAHWCDVIFRRKSPAWGYTL